MNDALLYPDAARPLTLMREITALIAKLPYVERILIFGSLARQESDRWSDIDMLVITADQVQFFRVWEALNAAKPVVHHHPLTLQPVGGHVLGNVFSGESSFHCLDLNFMTRADYQVSGSLDRFGKLIEVYAGEGQVSADSENSDCASQELSPDEERIAYAMHFTKKNLKRMLRGSPDAELPRYLDILKQTIRDYPADYLTSGGQIGQVAHAYIRMAEELLRRE